MKHKDPCIPVKVIELGCDLDFRRIPSGKEKKIKA